MISSLEIAGRKIGPNCPCFIIAEAGVNHNGRVETAKQLIDVAVEAGADAVKFQTFKAEEVASLHAPKAAYQRETTDAAESQLEMLQKLELSLEAHRDLQTYCQERGVFFMSTPFDEGSVDLLDELGVPVFKIGSGEVTNWPLLKYIARKGKPIIFSTGMAYLSEIDEAVRVIRDAGNDQLVLLHCVSNYPADPMDVNLRAMHTMETAFHLPVGYSDHTPGIEVALAAVALGACVIEKHFTLDRKMPGPDHRASLEPDELKAMVRGIRLVEQALGSGYKVPALSEADTIRVARRSIVAAHDISVGAVLTEEDLAAKRPGTGLPPALQPYVVGRTARTAIPAGTLIRLEMLT
jgi:N,N'-diacetyllegionaminate synthase